ncbi:MAG: Dna-J like membrane chaperone protein [Pelotomaculum sp. PtaU1.Bin035]|nr:MAG: Dna-J like membrane chaperone protein [Pelotomaculum sp. PtaU1.Bin035]
MFANMLLKEEKESLLKLLLYLSMIDGKLTKEEIDFINSIASEIGLSSQNISDNIDDLEIDGILSEIKSDSSKKILLIELVNIAVSDGEYSDTEKRGLEIICNKLGISSEILNRIEKWVSEGKAWMKNGLNLIGE